MVMFFFMCACAVLAGILAWLALGWLQGEYARYRSTFQHQAVHGLADFFLFINPKQLWTLNIALSLLTAMVGWLVTNHTVASIFIASLTLLFPRALLHWARKRRRRRLDEQLPDFLLALAGALRAGAGLQSGLVQVARHSHAPLAQELSLLLQEQRMGVSFNDALDGFHKRVGTEAASLFTAAVKVASQSGGGLAETLESIASTLRMRLQLLTKIRALTSQGRLQAWIMAILPLVLASALYALDSKTMSQLWQTPVGWGVIVLIAPLEILGLHIVRRIVNIDV